ncbi:hypothetical protein BX616_001133 [Lobosporangium transversale]|nr:hypothetical protein BX616_001133 [Lobosporangium transversale]
MLGGIYPSSRSVLSPSIALKLFTIYTENARDYGKEIALELCLDAVAVLSRIHRSVRKALITSTRNEDKTLCQNVATAYYDLARSFERLGQPDEARNNDRKAEKWGYVQGRNVVRPRPPSISSSINDLNDKDSISYNDTKRRESTCIFNSEPEKPTKIVEPTTTDGTTIIPIHIFSRDVAPTAIRYSLPDAGTRLNDIGQLVYCLSLLPGAPIPTTELSGEEREWSLAMSKDRSEQERLYNLASNVITMFISDGIKTEATVTEVVSLAPVLSRDQFKALLAAFTNDIQKSTVLDTYLLEGLGQLMQHAPLGYLDSDDIIKILDTLTFCLKEVNSQSDDYLHHLSTAVSRALDVMVDNQVKGLKPEQLHEPLVSYLKGLEDSSDPHLMYHAAYAFQALQYIPDDGTTVQAMLRRRSSVFRGTVGIVSAVDDFDVYAFLDELSIIQKELPMVTDVINLSLHVYNGAASLYESKETIRQCIQEGLSLSQKTAWYPALRGADALIQTGEFTKFKTFVCEVPCRREPSFLWGLCQRLGQIAADTQWPTDARQDAVAFLGEIYKNDNDWGHYVHIKQWILAILKRLMWLSKESLLAEKFFVEDLTKNGDANKQQLFSDYFKDPEVRHPVVIALPPSTSLSLLDRVQKEPDIENNLRQLKRQRMRSRDDQSFYIPQFSRGSARSKNEGACLLMDEVKEFLNGDQKVLLVQGTSGAGKSTFSRTLEYNLWEAYQNKNDRIPLYIDLPSIENPNRGLVTKLLRRYGFTEAQITELRMTRSFILICDGYDECRQHNNLYVTNQLNQPGEWMAQMIITCRSEYLRSDSRDYFQPMARKRQAGTSLFQEVVIVPFSDDQINNYIKQYVAIMNPPWPVKEYQRVFEVVPGLRKLVENPFFLSLSLEVLPRMIGPNQDVSKTEVKCISFYDQFVELWLERGKKRVGDSIEPEDRKMFQKLSDEGFEQNGIRYLTSLAVAIYRHQRGDPVVDYSSFKHKGTWKEEFFSKENGASLLREASPLSRVGTQARFIHQSILEYSLVRAIFEPQQVINAFASGRGTALTPNPRRQSISSVYSFDSESKEANPFQADENSPLVWKNFVNDPFFSQFLEDRARLEPLFRQQLYGYIELSKEDKKWRTAAANAITILVRAGESFLGADLRGIQIPGADLSGGMFGGTKLRGADLRKVNLQQAWLRDADMRGARAEGIQFGEWPFFTESAKVRTGTYSPDGEMLAIAIDDGTINVYYTLTWEKLHTLKGVTGSILEFLPDNKHLVCLSSHQTVEIWNAILGQSVKVMYGHSGAIHCMGYSPDGTQVASSSDDGSVRVWNALSGILIYELKEHTGAVFSLMYSPDGRQIATGGKDKTIRLWETLLGQPIRTLQDLKYEVYKIAYSPNSQEIISYARKDYSVDVWDVGSGQRRWTLVHTGHVEGAQYSPSGDYVASFAGAVAIQWDMHTGEAIHTFDRHPSSITDLKYSPNGEEIATCSKDGIVRLWDAQSGQLISTLRGHSGVISSLVYSPSSQQIASFGDDGMVRLWNTQLKQTCPDQNRHTRAINCIRISPDGRYVASSSYDGTIRVWNARTGQFLHVLQDIRSANDIKYSADGQLIGSCHTSSFLRLWNSQSGQVAHTIEWEEAPLDGCWAMDFSPVDHRIACGHACGKVSVWDTKTGNCIRILQSPKLKPGKDVFRVLYSPDGRKIASWEVNGRIRVWSAESWDLLCEFLSPRSCGPAMAFSPNSERLAFFHDDIKLRICELKSGEVYCEIPVYDTPIAIIYSSCGLQVAIGTEEGSISLVDTEAKVITHTLEGHTSLITCMVYSPDEQYIASGNYDRTLRLWNTETGQCLYTISLEIGFVSVILWYVSEEGYFLLVGCDDSSLEMYQLRKVDGQLQHHLKWGTRQRALNVSNLCIFDMIGLSESIKQLLLQRGAIVDPTRRSTPEEEDSWVSTVRSTESKAKLYLRKKELKSKATESKPGSSNEQRLVNLVCKGCDVIPTVVCGCTTKTTKTTKTTG